MLLKDVDIGKTVTIDKVGDEGVSDDLKSAGAGSAQWHGSLHC